MKNARASFSRLQFYQNCPQAYKFKYLDKVTELPRPSISNATGEHANDRGSRVHETADDYINHRTDDLIPELQSFREEFASARLLKSANPDLIHTEQRWTSDQEWIPTNADIDTNYHLIVIVDLMIFTNEEKTHARIIDFKTGKEYGNEIKHATQLQLYAVAVFERFPELESIDAEIWYLDKRKEPKVTPFTREQALRFKKFWDGRINTMARDEEYTAKPHEKSCMFCAYGKSEHNNKWVAKNDLCQLSMDKRDRV